MREYLIRPVRVLRVAAALAALACGSDKVTDPEWPALADVVTPGSIFSPPTADIRLGGTVRFTMSRASDGFGHNARFSGVPNSPPGAPEDVPIVVDTVVSRDFNARGTFGYVCDVHPGMAGEVIVH